MNKRKGKDIGKNRVCSTCQVEKPRTHDYYSVNRYFGDGMNRICKECDNKRRRESAKSKKYHNIITTCHHCKNVFYVTLTSLNIKIRNKKEKSFFCSKSCWWIYRKNMRFTIYKNNIQYGNEKLTYEDVKLIRQKLSDHVSVTEIAQLFKLAYGTVWNIKYHHSWREV